MVQSPAVPEFRKDTTLSEATVAHRRGGVSKGAIVKKKWLKADLTGRKFGRLTAMQHVNKSRWLCKCECGGTSITSKQNLEHGISKSCGCLKLEFNRTQNLKHGRARHGQQNLTWRTWAAMRGRCLCAGNVGYKHYGGRGITICERWLESFNNFLMDMGERPDGMTLGRINNDGPYCKENCRWETPAQQACNKRTTRFVTACGETKTISQWAKILNTSFATIFGRIDRGWTGEEAVTAPIKRNSRSREF